MKLGMKSLFTSVIFSFAVLAGTVLLQPAVASAQKVPCDDGVFVNLKQGQSIDEVCNGHGGQPAAGSMEDCSHSFLGLETWYQYMAPEEFNADCTVKCFNVFNQSKANDCGQKKSDIPLVLLAVVDDLLRIAGLVAVGFIFYAAFNFITSQGDPEDAARARNTAINALVGLVIAMVAVALVSFIGRKLGG